MYPKNSILRGLSPHYILGVDRNMRKTRLLVTLLCLCCGIMPVVAQSVMIVKDIAGTDGICVGDV